MNENVLTALVNEGYKGADIFEYERCLHNFQLYQRFRITEKGIIENAAVECEKCGCDDHAALLMGLNPLYLERKNLYV